MSPDQAGARAVNPVAAEGVSAEVAAASVTMGGMSANRDRSAAHALTYETKIAEKLAHLEAVEATAILDMAISMIPPTGYEHPSHLISHVYSFGSEEPPASLEEIKAEFGTNRAPRLAKYRERLDVALEILLAGDIKTLANWPGKNKNARRSPLIYLARTEHYFDEGEGLIPAAASAQDLWLLADQHLRRRQPQTDNHTYDLISVLYGISDGEPRTIDEASEKLGLDKRIVQSADIEFFGIQAKTTSMRINLDKNGRPSREDLDMATRILDSAGRGEGTSDWWRLQACARADPNKVFDSRYLLKICAGCSVQMAMRAEALDRGLIDVTYGGLQPPQLTKIYRKEMGEDPREWARTIVGAETAYHERLAKETEK